MLSKSPHLQHHKERPFHGLTMPRIDDVKEELVILQISATFSSVRLSQAMESLNLNRIIFLKKKNIFIYDLSTSNINFIGWGN